MDVYVNNKRLRIKPRQTIGKGGEADVFAIDAKQAVKIFKPPEHPDYTGNPIEQQGAVERIAEHQKKLPAFPTTLPPKVIAPLKFVFEKPGQQIIGYTMPRLKNTQPLMRFADIRFRQTGVSTTDVINIFRDLHQTITAIHRSNTVIGDFNDLNVLVNRTHAYISDKVICIRTFATGCAALPHTWGKTAFWQSYDRINPWNRSLWIVIKINRFLTLTTVIIFG